MRVTMATHQRKCILQETLIPSPRSWDSLTFHSHTVIRYQLSVQGGRLRGCSPAGGGGAHKGGGGGREERGEEGVKDTGTLSGGWAGAARLPQSPASRRAPAHLETPPARGPSHSTRTCCARAPARRPLRSPFFDPASPLSAHLLRSPPSWDAAHLSFVRGGTIRSAQLSFRERPLCARRRAKPDLCNPHRPSAVGASAAPRPGRSGVWPFAQGHADLNSHPDAHLTTKLQRLPIASTSVIAPGASQPPRETKQSRWWLASWCT